MKGETKLRTWKLRRRSWSWFSADDTRPETLRMKAVSSNASVMIATTCQNPKARHVAKRRVLMIYIVCKYEYSKSAEKQTLCMSIYHQLEGIMLNSVD